MKILGLLTAMIFAGMVGEASAATYYVATTGNDGNTGTSASPLRTITFAVESKAVCGDTVIVKAGTYTDHHATAQYGILLNKNCSSGSPFILKSEVRLGAIIDAQMDTTRQHAISPEGGNYNTIDGFKIINSYRTCIVDFGTTTSHLTISNNEMTNCGNNSAFSNEHGAIWMGDGAQAWVISGNFIHDTGNFTCNGHGGSIVCGSALNISGNGWTIVNNIIANHPSASMQIAPGSTTTLTGAVIYNNTMIPGTTQTGQYGITIDGEYGGTFSNLLIKNNIIANSLSPAIVTCTAPGSGIIADTNLGFNTVGTRWSEVCTSSTVTHTETNWITSNPMFISSSDFHLQTGSPAIDTGLALGSVTVDFDGNARPQGAAWDIGAYEFLGGGGPPPTTCQ